MPDWMDGKSIVNVVKHTINDTEMAGAGPKAPDRE